MVNQMDLSMMLPIIKLIIQGDITKKKLKKKLPELEKKQKNEGIKIIVIKESEPVCDDRNLDDEYNNPKDLIE